MPIDLSELTAPHQTALLALELQRGTVGDRRDVTLAESPGSPLAEIAQKTDLLRRLGVLFGVARAAGVKVIHCTAAFREDGAGAGVNAPLLARAYKGRQGLLAGSLDAAPALELGPAPEDIISLSPTGVAPFIGTGLDVQLRNLGVNNVVLVGGSVNVAVVGAAIEAVDLGYRVVVPRDGVIGHPVEYADAVIEHTLKLLSRLTSVDELCAQWRR